MGCSSWVACITSFGCIYDQVITIADHATITSGPRIYFRVFERGGFQDQEQSPPYGPSKVKRVATEYVRKGSWYVVLRFVLTRAIKRAYNLTLLQCWLYNTAEC